MLDLGNSTISITSKSFIINIVEKKGEMNRKVRGVQMLKSKTDSSVALRPTYLFVIRYKLIQVLTI